MFFGVGANGVFSAARLRQAARLCGSVPPSGAHLSVYVRFGASPWPFGQTVMWSEVAASRIAAKTVIAPG
jgi:hypothetical protein